MLIKKDLEMPIIRKLRTIPVVARLIGRTLAAWLADPNRFKTRNALSSYGGLGIGQGVTNWKVTGAARASRRGQRALKRVLFIAAQAAIKGDNALAKRYQAHCLAWWNVKKATRDIARHILFAAWAIWKSGKEYQDARVAITVVTPAR